MPMNVQAAVRRSTNRKVFIPHETKPYTHRHLIERGVGSLWQPQAFPPAATIASHPLHRLHSCRCRNDLATPNVDPALDSDMLAPARSRP